MNTDDRGIETKKRLRLTRLVLIMPISLAIPAVAGFMFITKVLGDSANVGAGIVGATLVISTYALARGLHMLLLRIHGDHGVLTTTQQQRRQASRRVLFSLAVSIPTVILALIGLTMMKQGHQGTATILFAIMAIILIPISLKLRRMRKEVQREAESKVAVPQGRRRLCWVALGLVVLMVLGVSLALSGLYYLIYPHDNVFGFCLLIAGVAVYVLSYFRADSIEYRLQSGTLIKS